jgi:hypothetical protein
VASITSPPGSRLFGSEVGGYGVKRSGEIGDQGFGSSRSFSENGNCFILNPALLDLRQPGAMPDA